MNGLNNSSDDVVECPLCMEPLEVDDLSFYPCTCGYQICRFCWHRIRTDENELCPACRKEYPENPADFTPLTQEEMIAFKSQKRQRDQQRKQKITENRKHLSNVRVVQRNLVFVVGLPPRLADADVLKKLEYFGKYGKIHKVVINPSTTYAGAQGPSASAYVTYVQNCDALRAIQSVNNLMIDGRLVKTSLGTTKYCSHFMKNQQCPKGDCMYLHELGDPEASFTKEEMHQGKHQEYEKRLHDALIATAGASSASGMGTASIGSGGNITTCASTGVVATATTTHSTHSKNGDSNKLSNGNTASSSSSLSVSSTASSSMSTSSTSSTSSLTNSTGTAAAAVATGANGTQPKDAWPSLSVSPVNNGKESASSGGGGISTQRFTKGRREKRQEKNARNKNKNGSSSTNNSSSNNSNSTTNKENHHPHSHTNGTKEPPTTTAGVTASVAADVAVTDSKCRSKGRGKADKSKTSTSSNRNSNNHQQQKQQKQQEQQRRAISADEEVKLIQAADKIRDRRNSSQYGAENPAHCSDNVTLISDEQRSLSASSSNSSSNSSSDNTSTLSESTSGKSSPSSFPEHSNNNKAIGRDGIAAKSAAAESVVEFEGQQQEQKENPIMQEYGSFNGDSGSDIHHNSQQHTVPSNPASPLVGDSSATPASAVTRETDHGFSITTESDTGACATAQKISAALEQISPSNSSGSSNSRNSSNIIDTTAALSKLNIFDDNNSFFSSATSFQQSLLLKNKKEAEIRPHQLNSAITSHLPDLLNGVDGFQNTTANSNEWEEAFKNIMVRNNKQLEEQLQHQSPLYHQQQQQQQQLQQHEEFLRMQELQKRNSLLNNIGLSQMNGPHNDFPNNFNGTTDLSRLSQAALIQYQQQMLQQQQERLQQSAAYSADHLLGNSLFGTNMSKFFDFHKNQQQLHQHFMVNGHAAGGNSERGSPLSDQLRMASLLENSRVNSQFLDKPSNGVLTQHQQQQLQKQRLLGGKFDPVQLAPQQLQSQNTQQQQQQSRIPNQFSHSSSADDDLGFDPFIETQKALAELMENEMVQQQKPSTSSGASNPTTVATKILQQQHHQQLPQQHTQQQQHLLDSIPRARMPPPGFNHMNAFGFGVPRAQSSSKILPFMNVNGSGSAGGAANGQPSQPQMQIPPNSWNPHLAAAAVQQQQHQHTLGGDSQLHMSQQNLNGGGNHNKGYNGSNDWTAMDPAILSFRQFSSFPQQQQQLPMPPHRPPQDLFMQHHVTQQQQQNGFGTQSQLHSGINLPNPSALLNPQNTAAQVNLLHSNWLSTEQSLFMNSLANGFTNNNFDKFSIQMPPGIHPNNLNKQQKTECIN